MYIKGFCSALRNASLISRCQSEWLPTAASLITYLSISSFQHRAPEVLRFFLTVFTKFREVSQTSVAPVIAAKPVGAGVQANGKGCSPPKGPYAWSSWFGVVASKVARRCGFRSTVFKRDKPYKFKTTAKFGKALQVLESSRLRLWAWSKDGNAIFLVFLSLPMKGSWLQ